MSGASFGFVSLIELNCNNSRFFLSVIRVTEVLGYKPQDLLNELCYDFFHPDDLEHMMESYQQGLCIFSTDSH